MFSYCHPVPDTALLLTNSNCHNLSIPLTLPDQKKTTLLEIVNPTEKFDDDPIV